MRNILFGSTLNQSSERLPTWQISNSSLFSQSPPSFLLRGAYKNILKHGLWSFSSWHLSKSEVTAEKSNAALPVYVRWALCSTPLLLPTLTSLALRRMHSHTAYTPQLFSPPFISLWRCWPPDECVAAVTITGALHLGASQEMPALPSLLLWIDTTTFTPNCPHSHA